MKQRTEQQNRLGWWQLLLGFAATSLVVWGGLQASGLIAPQKRAPRSTVPAAIRPNAPAIQGAAISRPNCARVACLALTFDDGPDTAVTPQVLTILERHNVHATFFVVGSRVGGNEALLRRMYQDGDEIGNHSWSHPDFTTLSPGQIRDQIGQTQAVIAAANVPVPTLFRPPYGAVNAVVRANVPLSIALWNVDPKDWDTGDTKVIISSVESTAKPGGVVELHDIHQQTADSLDQLLNDLTARYQLVTVSDMLNLAPGQPGEFFGR